MEKNSLWKNIRNKAAQNRRTGASPKAPTKEMLKQERKINNRQVGGNNADDELMQLFNQFADSVDDDDFNTGEDVYNEYNKLSPDEQQQFIESIKGQNTALSSQSEQNNQENNQEVQNTALMQRGGFIKNTSDNTKVNTQRLPNNLMLNKQRLSKLTDLDMDSVNYGINKQYPGDNYFNGNIKDSTTYNDIPDQQLQALNQFKRKVGSYPNSKEIDYINNSAKPKASNEIEYLKYLSKRGYSKDANGDSIPYVAYPDKSDSTYIANYNKQTGGIPTNENGYYELDPKENPIARIPSGRITMKNIPYKIKAVGGTTGKDYGYMQPEGEYNFGDEKFMYEIPKAQKGFDVNDYTRNKNLESLNSKEYQDYLAKIENEKNAKSLQDSMDAIKYKNTKGFITKDYFGGNDNTPFYNLPFTPNQNQNTIVTPTVAPANSNVPYKIKATKSRGKKPFANVSATNTEVPSVVVPANVVAPDLLPENPFSNKQLNAQYLESLESQKELAKIETPNVPTKYPEFIAPTNNKYIKGKSVTMNFDNPAEAQAIAYKKFKNNQSLAPYKQSVNLQSPGLYQENESTYLANIRENRNSALQNINPNSTIGQSAMSGVYAQGLNQENEAIGQVNKNNAQNTTNYLNQRSSINNQQQQMNNQYNDKYYNDVAQIESVKNQNDINYMDEISQMNAKRLQAKNRILANGIESGLGDALDVNDNSVTFDTSKIGAIINGGNNRKAAASSSNYNNKVNLKMIGGVPYHTYMDENGNAQATKVNIEKGQWGGMGKYKMKLK